MWWPVVLTKAVPRPADAHTAAGCPLLNPVVMRCSSHWDVAASICGPTRGRKDEQLLTWDLCVCVKSILCLCLCLSVIKAAACINRAVNQILHTYEHFHPYCVSASAANSVLRNRRPHMMRPTGSHSTYHFLRGQTVELECIVQGLWVSLSAHISAPFMQKTCTV